jgi:hypothetical protein
VRFLHNLEMLKNFDVEKFVISISTDNILVSTGISQKMAHFL